MQTKKASALSFAENSVALKYRLKTAICGNTAALSSHRASFTESLLPIALRKVNFIPSIEEKAIALMRALETKDPYTRGHSESVACYSIFLAKEIGVNADMLETLELAAYLHDIGKIMIDSRILIKPIQLNPTEELILKTHPEVGVRLLQTLSMPEEIKTAILSHHERFDGSGYPSRLSKEEIPLSSRILSIADAFDAMTSDRPYRIKKNIHETFDEIKNGAGKQFDPELVSCFTRGLERYL